MLFDDDSLDGLVSELIKQWNIAEERIKKAEQVRGNEVVASAIFELRYAGRKIIDAMMIAQSEDWRQNREAYGKIHAFLADAVEDCVKAKHDAIDAMMTFVTSWFSEAEDSLGLDKLQQFFPEYLETTGMISGVQEKIAESRGNRTTHRDGIYDELDRPGAEYDRVLSLFDKMKRSKERVEAVVRRERNAKKVMFALTITGVALGIWAIFFS